ncbi:hypothetical protein KOW79_007732 [Hemibagrus wyckioides]|uniref:Uncharacterized protein n=1 Tax=Hemibagrus wyckioides TaxID=337641 RepID=A0A9D3NV06_9TELE|nr:hypothetical protein KOW79_007732 [Hemibagrus wyckioides]
MSDYKRRLWRMSRAFYFKGSDKHTEVVQAAFAEAPQPSSLRPRSCSEENKVEGEKRKNEGKKESSAHLTSIAELSVCVPPSHWYLDEAGGAVTRALLRKADDVIEVPSLQAADEAPLDGPGQFPRLFGQERNHAKEGSAKECRQKKRKPDRRSS